MKWNCRFGAANVAKTAKNAFVTLESLLFEDNQIKSLIARLVNICQEKKIVLLIIRN